MTDTELSLHMIEETLMAFCALTVHPSAGVEALESKRDGYRQMMAAIRTRVAERGTCATCQWWTGRGAVGSSPTARHRCLANEETEDMFADDTLWTSAKFGCSLHKPTEQP